MVLWSKVIMSTPFWVCLFLLTTTSCHGRPNWPSGEPESDSSEEMLEERINLHHSFKDIVDASTKAIKDVQKYLTQKVTSAAEKHINTLSRPLSKIIAPIVLVRDRLLGLRNCSGELNPYHEHSDTRHPIGPETSSQGVNSQMPEQSHGQPTFSQPIDITSIPKDEHSDFPSHPFETESNSHGVNSQIPEKSHGKPSFSQPTGATSIPKDEHSDFPSHPLETESSGLGENSQIPEEYNGQSSSLEPTGVTSVPKDDEHFTSYPLEVESSSEGVANQVIEEADGHSSLSHPAGVTSLPKDEEQTDFPAFPVKGPVQSDDNLNSDANLAFTESSEHDKEPFASGRGVDIRFGQGKGSLDSLTL